MVAIIGVNLWMDLIMNDYQQKIITEYARSISRAERLLKDSEHDMWMTEVSPLYDISLNLREAMHKISEEMHQAVYAAQQEQEHERPIK